MGRVEEARGVRPPPGPKQHHDIDSSHTFGRLTATASSKIVEGPHAVRLDARTSERGHQALKSASLPLSLPQ
jgi:hypothetical protein